jgi:hypothetical protein
LRFSKAPVGERVVPSAAARYFYARIFTALQNIFSEQNPTVVIDVFTLFISDLTALFCAILRPKTGILKTQTAAGKHLPQKTLP